MICERLCRVDAARMREVTEAEKLRNAMQSFRVEFDWSDALRNVNITAETSRKAKERVGEGRSKRGKRKSTPRNSGASQSVAEQENGETKNLERNKRRHARTNERTDERS